jgi:hypothetical protein
MRRTLTLLFLAFIMVAAEGAWLLFLAIGISSLLPIW